MISCRFAFLLFLFSTSQTLADPPNNPKFDRGPWNSCPPGDPVKDPGSWNFTDRITGGFVESIAEGVITLYWPALDVLRLRHDPMTGEQLEEMKKTLPAVPAKKFLLGEELTKGGYVKTGIDHNTYRITDVRVGDRVTIHYDRRNGVDLCRTICINRRPNGDVPPAPGEKPDVFHKWHESVNADQDWEQSRVPYPRKYWPTYMGADGKFYAGPYPQESTQIVPIRPAIAPPPRKVPPAKG